MSERRRGQRRRSWFVMRVESDGNWLAMSRNVSDTGALLATAKRLDIGQAVALTFRPTPDSEQEQTVEGTIVRVERNVEDPGGLWPHRVAVEFDSPLPELEKLIERDSGTWKTDYLRELEDGET